MEREARQIDAGKIPDPESADVIIIKALAQPQPDLDGANIARMREHLRESDDPESFVIVDRDPAYLYSPILAVQPISGPHEPLLQSRGPRDDLEGRPGLIVIGHCPVPPGKRGGLGA